MRLPGGARGGGLGVIVIVVLVALIGGPDALNLLFSEGGGTFDGAPVGTTERGPAAVNDAETQFIASILGSTEDVWGSLFAASGGRYEAPLLTLFAGSVSSACGYATAASGPFYCPADRRVYLDTSFFDQLARMGGPGDFAQAYVIGHEIGHHVQNLLGTAGEVRRQQQVRGQAAANQLQVAMELQADCFAGVWAARANAQQQLLEPGDVAEGLAAAAAIGDDTLQSNAGRRVTPDSFTHGSAAQRQQWLRLGLQTGDPGACDTFE
jgi:predicted metalloprotease